MSSKKPDIRPADHEERMAVAREVAQWELGDPSWAGVIVGAYLWPDGAHEGLEAGGDARLTGVSSRWA